MTPRLLIPVKSLQAGKSRLSPVLDEPARRRLNEFFLRHVARVAKEFPGASNTTVVSACDGVLSLATSLGMSGLRQTAGGGLNAAVRQGVESLRARGAEAILIIPSDLPLVEAADLREIASLGQSERIVVCPDKHRSGTNAIFLPPGKSIDFRFGQGSCAEHARQMGRGRALPLLHYNRRVAMDVDDPDDLACWLRDAKTGLPASFPGQRPAQMKRGAPV